MGQKITFTFPTSTITGYNSRNFRFKKDGVTLFEKIVHFVPTVQYGTDPYILTLPYLEAPSNNEIVKGSGINNFANNFKLWLDYQLTVETNWYNSFYFETSIAGNVVELIWGSNSSTDTFEFVNFPDQTAHTSAWLTYTVESYVIPSLIVPEVLADKIILSRSPYNFKLTPGITFDEITAEVYIYRGHKTDDRPLVSNYQISKSVVQVGQDSINFDIHKLVNDFVKNSYNGVATDPGAYTLSTLDTVWCYIDAKIKLGGAEQYQANQLLLALDGFLYHTDTTNPLLVSEFQYATILTSLSNHIIYNNSDYPIYFLTQDLTGITINGTNVSFTFSQDYSNQKIAYVNVAEYIGSSTSFTAEFEYLFGDNVYTHNFTVKDECKYPLINCIFKNRFGVWQTIPFNKLSKKSQEFTNENYNGLISNYGDYSLNSHVKRTYNINGREKVTVNTDFIPEEYNALFTELMLSEFIYLEENGQVLPVNLLKNSFEKKTKLINKLIQYSMDFEYSFDLLNNIQ